MIAVTGASGQLGKLVLEELINLGTPANKITALARSTEKLASFVNRGVQVVYADYNKPESLDDALKSITRLLLISSSEVGQRIQQHKAVIDSAKKNGVEFIAYTSILSADESPLALAAEHKATETLIRDSSIPYTLLRHGWYSENYLMGISNAVEMGSMFGCAGDGKFSTATRADYALAAATVLTTTGHAGNTYELAGDEAFTLEQFAEYLSKAVGKEIKYQNMDENSYKDILVQAGLPEPLAAILANSEALAQKGWLFNDSRQLSGLIGRNTTTIQQSISEEIK